MSSPSSSTRVPAAAEGERRRRPAVGGTRWLWTAYAVLGGLLAGYLASLIARPAGQTWLLVDGWMVAVFELVAGALCIACALVRPRRRAVSLALGAGLLAWAVGHTILTIESAGGNVPAAPSLADLSYLAFYPLAYTALVLILRREVRDFIPATWLDGAVAGLGAAAAFAAFAFDTILSSAGGDRLGVAVNLAYPIGDVVLLGLVVGGMTIASGGRGRAGWRLLALGCAVIAAGDTVNLFHSSVGTSRAGVIVHGVAWPTTILLISLSVWLRPARSDLVAPRRAPAFILPGLGATAGLAILFTGTVQHVDWVALALATATLVAVGVRLTLSVRGLRALTDEHYHKAVTDQLTGLANRRRLMDVLDKFFDERAVDGSREHHLAFLFIDLNHFKEINDSFGHSVGDDLLRQLGPRLAGSLRSVDLLVRFGGDELGVVVMDADHEHAAWVARRLIAALEEPFILEGLRVRISASIGIAIAPTDAADTAALLRCADMAMYRAKLAGSTFEIYQRDIEGEGDRLRLADELRVAVDERRLLVHYQPLANLHSAEIHAVEALLRWPHPRLGLVPPLEFLPLAEEAGLMLPLTTLVLDEALTQCAAWRSEGRDLAVSVNVSASNLLDPGFIDLVSGLLSTHRFPPTALTLEITGTAIVADFERYRLVMSQLRALGVGMSIDAFGAGFTSLTYLGGLPVCELKLHRSLIVGLTDEHRWRDRALVRATIRLGHALGLRVVGEGVEDSATLDLLIEAGCDLAQGDHISRPMTAADLNGQPWGRAAPLAVAGLRAS